MFGVSTSLYLRVPFELDAANRVSALKLAMQYDDGYVAYINGQEIARQRPGRPELRLKGDGGAHGPSRRKI